MSTKNLKNLRRNLCMVECRDNEFVVHLDGGCVITDNIEYVKSLTPTCVCPFDNPVRERFLLYDSYMANLNTFVRLYQIPRIKGQRSSQSRFCVEIFDCRTAEEISRIYYRNEPEAVREFEKLRDYYRKRDEELNWLFD